MQGEKAGMSKLLKIGELARAAGCTVKAVRFYEAKGLLPKPGRSPSGYRLYTEQTVKLLQFVRRAKLIGLPLAKIGELMPHLSEVECACSTVRPHLEHLVRTQLAETNAKLAQLALLKEEIEGLLTKMRRARRTVPGELCVCAGTEKPASKPSISLIRVKQRPPGAATRSGLAARPALPSPV